LHAVLDRTVGASVTTVDTALPIVAVTVDTAAPSALSCVVPVRIGGS